MSRKKLINEALHIIQNGVPEEPKVYIVNVKEDGTEICKDKGYPDEVTDQDTVIRLIRVIVKNNDDE